MRQPLNLSYSSNLGREIGWMKRRGTAIAAIGIVIAVVFVGRGSIPLLSSPQEDLVTPKQIDFDAYATGVTSILYNSAGGIEYTLEATEQTHYLDNTTKLSDPFVRLYKDNDARWNIIARSGRILEASNGDAIERLDLSENVELFQVDDFGNRTVLATETITIFPGTETMSTDQAVTLTSDGLYQTAVGMRVDFSQDTMTFLSQVKGRYEAQ